MPSDLRQRYLAGQRSGKERRSGTRYPFAATCDATEAQSCTGITGRISDLGRGGCYIDTIGPFPMGTMLVVRINRGEQTLTIEGQVAFAQPGMGMGMAFTNAAPNQQQMLEEWIAELSGEAVDPSASAKPEALGETPGATQGAENAILVINELILTLLRKGLLTESEGRSLLQKLLR